jgi:hypothetical protein
MKINCPHFIYSSLCKQTKRYTIKIVNDNHNHVRMSKDELKLDPRC